MKTKRIELDVTREELTTLRYGLEKQINQTPPYMKEPIKIYRKMHNHLNQLERFFCVEEAAEKNLDNAFDMTMRDVFSILK